MEVFLIILSEEARTSGMKATVHAGKHTMRHNKINSTLNYINLDRKNEQESVKMPLLCNYKPLIFFSCTLLGLLASFAHTCFHGKAQKISTCGDNDTFVIY